MFCGQLPFTSKSPLELVHCHIAARPPPPEKVTTIPSQEAATQLICRVLDGWYW
jgi:hypothetical protein